MRCCVLAADAASGPTPRKSSEAGSVSFDTRSRRRYQSGFSFGGGDLGGSATALTTLRALRPRDAARSDAGASEAAPRDALAAEAAALGLWFATLAVAVAGVALIARRCRGPSAPPFFSRKKAGISLQTLSYGFAPDLDFEFGEAYEHAMAARHLMGARGLVMIDPSEIVLKDVIGEGSFGRVWSATWQSSEVAVKEFVLAQAAFAGGSMHRRDIIEEIVGEAGIMAYLRHPKVLQLYGCSLTAQAIWIV